jgi:type VI secretion system secreted protein Hcp
MAETVHLYLKLNGTTIPGDSTQGDLGRAGSIECTSFAFDVEKDGSDIRTGEIKIAARIDKAEPLIVKGLVEGQTADGVFKFFRPNPTGDGTTEQFFTVSGKSGRVTAAQMWVPDTMNPASSTLPPMMQYAFSFSSIDETYTNGGITVSWS